MSLAGDERRMNKADLPSAIEVHRRLGPGLPESIYESAMLHELTLCGMPATRQCEIRVPCKDIELAGQRLDLVVGGFVVVERTRVERVHPVHRAQLLSYLRAGCSPLGYLVNFNTPRLMDSVTLVCNGRGSPVRDGTSRDPSSPSRPSR